MRGEDACIGVVIASAHRITPACAGKTTRKNPRKEWRADHPRMRGEDSAESSIWADASSDHPRMRGEDMYKEAGSTSQAGSPPHARGRLARIKHANLYFGITPACAGKTSPGSPPR